MTEENGPQGPERGAYGDRYFGPFGDPAADDTAPLGIGQWTPVEAPSGAPGPGPGYAAPPSAAVNASWPPPAEVVAPVALAPRPVRRPRTGRVIAAAALTAALVGGGAGYGGARLAERQAADLPVAADPTTTEPAQPAGAASQTPLPPAPSAANTVAVAKRLLPSVVMIQVGQGTGSGFVLDTKGRIVTNNHVVAGAANGDRIRVVFADGRTARATLVGRSPSYDIAVIKVKGSAALHPVQLGSSARSQVGEPVIAIGSPLGLPGTVTQGIISAKDRPVAVSESGNADARTAYLNAIQTDAPINPGNSGGPLIDAAARVIGVNSAILTMGAGSGQAGNIGLGFAIPVDQAKTIAGELIRDGKATYPVIGASVKDGSDGVELTSVDGGGPARKAGLRIGDVVTRIDAKRVNATPELIVTVRSHRPGDQVMVDYTRGASDRRVRLTLGSKEG